MSLLSGLLSELGNPVATGFHVAQTVARNEQLPAAKETAPPPMASVSAFGSGEHYTKKAVTNAGGEAEIPESLRPPNHHPPMVDGPDQPQHFILSAATASPEWRQARDQYINHLMSCRSCHAPTGRYCAAGAGLRQRYDQTPMECAQ